MRVPPTFRSLAHRDFALYWGGQFLSNTGIWLQLVAQGWLVLELTDSPLHLGLVGLCRAVPILSLGFVAGGIADRIDRRRLLIATQCASSLLALSLAVLTWGGWVRVEHVLAYGLLSAATLAFEQPARHALLPALVPRADLMNAISLTSLLFHGSALFGPSIAGLLIPAIGAEGCFFLNSATYLAVVLALLVIRPATSATAPRRRPEGAGSEGGTLWSDLGHTIGTIRRDPLLWTPILLNALISFNARSYMGLMPVFARDVLQVGVVGYGWLQSAPGLGTVIGALALASARTPRRQGAMILGGGLLLSLGLCAFAWSPSFPLSLLLLVGIGALTLNQNASSNTLLQLRVPERERGRILGLLAMSSTGLQPLGQLPQGWMASHWGAPIAVTIGASVTAAACLYFLRTQPALWAHETAKEASRAG